MANAPVNIITSLVTLGVKYLKQENISSEESMITMLSLSGIVNLLDIKMLDIYQNVFTEAQWECIVDEEKSMDINSYSGLNDESNKILNRLLALRNTDEILEHIDEQKYLLSKSKQSGEQQYAMLLIAEQIGENANEATKTSIDVNRSIFGLREQSNSFGRRMNLMLGIKYGKKRLEISSNEFKRSIASKDVVQKQQCKNLRTNSCIIQQIVTRYKINTSVMAMDFVGCFGCLYMLKKTEEQFYIAKLMAKLAIPYHFNQLGALKPTLNVLFQMKSFLIEQARHINEAMFELDVGNTLPSLNLPTLSTASASTIGDTCNNLCCSDLYGFCLHSKHQIINCFKRTPS
ncbi:hypothetical protein G6F46_012808 [Rhizopus delemar]|uniref:Uncharacterized protein n=2 Tax=Rhizopus TaxID=4842 RepID=A0A9P6YRW3_9FUNG|nr:hypothetical protein G6F36_013187 [Rhizopus arrhizus]KAG1443424.1 hypothetical protein G6F55_012675 [Rhizopus delemar]KAG1487361.1 hypothetical protein G6F54_012707 [Rhizopus delemar]KAG1494516.1 hypothetical protein G6F53_012560 [Rhizopus delemar]KAG1503252.1 hypothetical protein G6F52_012297 [Rhizopus delemar]